MKRIEIEKIFDDNADYVTEFSTGQKEVMSKEHFIKVVSEYLEKELKQTEELRIKEQVDNLEFARVLDALQQENKSLREEIMYLKGDVKAKQNWIDNSDKYIKELQAERIKALSQLSILKREMLT